MSGPVQTGSNTSACSGAGGAARGPPRSGDWCDPVGGRSSSDFEPETLARIPSDLGQKRFGRDGKFAVRSSKETVIVPGDKEVIDWASAVVVKLKGN